MNFVKKIPYPIRWQNILKTCSGWLLLPERYLLLFLLTLCCGLTFAQGNSYAFDYFSQENGLSNNQVHCIFQDRKGFMWFGTTQGASRFDGYRFTVFENSPEDSTSLKGNLVRVIFENHEGKLFVGTENGGLNLFDREQECFSPLFDRHPELQLEQASANTIAEDREGRLWIGSDRCLLLLHPDGRLEKARPREADRSKPFKGNFVRVAVFDHSGKLWMGTNNGIFILDPAANVVKPFTLPFGINQNQEIWELLAGADGKIWIGTYASGIFIADPTTGELRHVNPDPSNFRSSTVRTISCDQQGNYWIGTRGGLYLFHPEKGVINSWFHDERDSQSLAHNSILRVFHDNRGDTWIGTRSGINLMIHNKQVFRQYRSLPFDNHYLNNNEVYCFWIDKQKKIWVGTEDGGVNILDPVSGTFEYLQRRPNDPNSLSVNCIKALMPDNRGNLWIGTFLGGIDVLNLTTRKITHYRHDPANPKSISDDRIWAFLSDSRQNIWIATSLGVDRFDPATGTFQHYPQLAGNEQVNWISEDSDGDIWMGTKERIIIYNPETEKIIRYPEYSRAFTEDSRKRVWITTLNRGVALYSKEKGALKYYREKDGLANNQTLGILEDNNRNLWVSTSNGLSCFNPETGFFRSFSRKDGLQNDQFCYGAAYKSPTGELLFGGISGFNIFNPLDIKANNQAAPIVLTDLKIFNKSIEISRHKGSILPKSISETDEITLPYSQKVFTVEFAALDFGNNEKNLYSYYLEGFDKEWNEPGTSRTATYTNLDPGQYVLRIKSVIPGIPDAGNERTLRITVLPPFWKTWLFKVLLLAVISLLIFTLIKFFINREKLKNELIFERMKARKLHELDMLKLSFFTNISHEIRTPLTLILGPLEKLMTNRIPPEEIPAHLEIINRNAQQLNRLINQILDFRKLETSSLKLEFSRGDLVSFVSGVVSSFENYAREKEINLHFNALTPKILALFDPDKLEKILNNLISNALKFTGTGGLVNVNLSLVFDTPEGGSGSQPDQRFVEITVKDTGTGISQADFDRIFQRFFQSGEERRQPGSGIGLALVKELVKLHDGKVFVSSEPDKGSLFTVRLPYLEAVSEETAPADEENQPADGVSESFRSKIMLLAEDNADVRYFIRSHFSSAFQILEARNGQEGWDIATKTIPDVIISDILMPEMDGLELCRRVKNDERTSHIPVILLTALTSKEQELEGLSFGADDYITKPFDLAILQTKVENLLSVRQSLKQKYTGELVLQPKNILISPPDERFLQRAIEAVEKNIADSDLDIERFAAEVGVSRMQLYRKLNALTDMTVKEFIRSIRLKRAAQLLLQKNLTVSEIAFSVGFKDVSHFRKCFRQEFGMSATQYIGQYDDENGVE